MTNKKEINELLTIFTEECAEAQIEALKIIRFGSEDSVSPVHRLEVEVGDLMCMVELLDEYGIINKHTVTDHIAAKREKLKIWSDLTKL